MKRKLFITIILLLCAGLATGCSEIERAYVKDQLKIMEWPGVEDVTNLRFAIKADEDIDINYTLKMETKVENPVKDGGYKIFLNLSGGSNNGKNGVFSNAQLIMDQEKMYLKAKDVLKILRAFEIEIPARYAQALENLGDKFFVFDYVSYQNSIYEQMLPEYDFSSMSRTILDDPVAFASNLLLGLVDLLPEFTTSMTKEDGYYVVRIDNENAAPLIHSYFESIIRNIEGLIEIFPYPENLKKELLAQIQFADKEDIINEYRYFLAPEIEEAIDMGTVSFIMKALYNPNDYENKMELILEYPEFSMELSIDSLSKKSNQALNLIIPAEEQLVDAVAFIEEQMLPEISLTIDRQTGLGQLSYYGADSNEVQIGVIIFDEEYYGFLSPARSVLTALGENVIWQEDLHAAYVSTPYGPVYLDGEIINMDGNDLLYISPWEFIRLGYDIDWDYYGIYISKQY